MIKKIFCTKCKRAMECREIIKKISDEINKIKTNECDYCPNIDTCQVSDEIKGYSICDNCKGGLNE